MLSPAVFKISLDEQKRCPAFELELFVLLCRRGNVSQYEHLSGYLADPARRFFLRWPVLPRGYVTINLDLG